MGFTPCLSDRLSMFSEGQRKLITVVSAMYDFRAQGSQRKLENMRSCWSVKEVRIM